MSTQRATYKVELEPLTVYAGSPREAAEFVKRYLEKNNAIFIVTPYDVKIEPVYIDLDESSED